MRSAYGSWCKHWRRGLEHTSYTNHVATQQPGVHKCDENSVGSGTSDDDTREDDGEA